MKKYRIAAILFLVIFVALAVVLITVRISHWIYKFGIESTNDSKYVIAEIVPFCDMLVVKEEFLNRKLHLRNGLDGWQAYNGDSLDIVYSSNLELRDQCVMESSHRYLSVSLKGAEIYEEEIYYSGKKLLVFDSDVPGGTKDTVCERIKIEFKYCEEEVMYEFYTGKELQEFSDGVFSKSITRFKADSILLSWGIKRAFPPEDFDWLFREEQLKKAIEKGRHK